MELKYIIISSIYKVKEKIKWKKYTKMKILLFQRIVDH